MKIVGLGILAFATVGGLLMGSSLGGPIQWAVEWGIPVHLPLAVGIVLSVVSVAAAVLTDFGMVKEHSRNGN